MNNFLDENFLLGSDTARELYHSFAKPMPIFDYHCHLPPREVAENKNFLNLTDIWLKGDHYKWRAMRAAGVDEKLITGDASDEEKFLAWARTVPKTLGNPLFSWTHLELKRYFGIEGMVLSPDTAREVWDRANGQLSGPGFRPRAIMEKFRVKLVCTTDDPADDHRDDVLQIPWGILGAGLGGLILLLGPFAAIIWLKARRTRRRRTDSDPVAAVAGAWLRCLTGRIGQPS